jgi:NADH dehydrogenase
MLPDVASGMVRPERICHPLEPHCRRLGVDFVRAEVRGISLAPGRVVTSAGTHEYDYLVLALGSETNYFASDAVREHSFGLKSVPEALSIAREAAMLAGRADAGRPRRARTKAHVLIVGGGYSGFEVAGAIARLVHVRSSLPFSRLGEIVGITILEKTDTVLPRSSAKVRKWVTDLVKNAGIDVRTGVTVKAFPAARTAELSDGTVLEDAMVIWTPGVRPASVCDALGVATLRDRRLKVDPYLRLPDNPTVFAAGDVAGATPPGREEPLRMSVQFSLRGGHCAALNILRSIRKEPLIAFNPRDPGYLVPLAFGRAAGEVMGREVYGRAPYWLHYAMCAFRSRGPRNRWAVFRDFVLKDLMRAGEERRQRTSEP